MMQICVALQITFFMFRKIIQFQKMNKLKEKAAPYNFEYSQAGSIKKGSHCMLDGQPCKIIELAISKPGKHGSAKILLTGINLLNDKKVQQIFSTSQTVLVPTLKKTELQVLDISQDDFVTFMNPDHSLKQDLKLPSLKEQKKKFRDIFQVNKQNSLIYFTIIEICGNEKIIAAKVVKI